MGKPFPVLPGSCCTCTRSLLCARGRGPWWPRRCTGWGRGRGPRSSPAPHTPWTAARTLPSEAGRESDGETRTGHALPRGRAASQVFPELLTFSLSVLTSFLSSLLFSLPGASAVGMDEWKMKSFPLHSAACRGDEIRRVVRRTKPSPAEGRILSLLTDECNWNVLEFESANVSLLSASALTSHRWKIRWDSKSKHKHQEGEQTSGEMGLRHLFAGFH